MSIKARLLIAICALVAAAFVLTGVATVAVTRAQMIGRVDDTLVATSAKDRHGPGPGGDFPGNVKQATATLSFAPDGDLFRVDPSGFPDDPDPLPDLSGFDIQQLDDHDGKIFTVGAVDGSDLRYRVLIREMNDGGFQAVAAPLADVDGTVHTLILVIGATSLAVLALLIGIVWFVIRRGFRPVDDMIATAGEIAAGDLSRRVDYDDPASEVGQLGQALNEMLGQIESSFAVKEASERRLRQFVADASHELRTPLTSIRGYAELHRSGAASSPADVERAMARIEAEGIRMSRLVEDLLLLARLDQGRPLRQESVDVVRLTEDAVMDARVVEPGRTIELEHVDEAHVTGDADRLRQVVDNLLSNVRIHTDPATPVRVSVATTDDEVILTVSDKGPGMSPEDAEHVFDRFYRADASRSRARGGSGLGLSIVDAIVTAHGGEVSLDTAPGDGTTIAIRLRRLSVDPPPAEGEPAPLSVAAIA